MTSELYPEDFARFILENSFRDTEKVYTDGELLIRSSQVIEAHKFYDWRWQYRGENDVRHRG